MLQLLSEIDKRQRREGKRPKFVFPGNGGTGHLVEIKKSGFEPFLQSLELTSTTRVLTPVLAPDAATRRQLDLDAKKQADELAAKKQADEAARKQADEATKKQTQGERHQQAVAHFKQAEAFFAAKLYADTITEYEAGNALELWPPSFFNIGEAYRLDGKGAKAIDAYKRYLELLPKGPRAAECRTNIALITKELRQKP